MVRVRRVLFRDWVKEADGSNPSRWHQISGTWAAQSNTIQVVTGAASRVAVGPAEQGAVCGTVAQAGEMYFDVTMNLVTTGVSSIMYFIIFASASSGAYLGNSYLLAIDSAKAYLYRSDSDALTELDNAVSAHADGTPYKYVIHYTPATGAWSVTEDGTEILTATDHIYETGSYLGLRAEQVTARYSLVRARCPDVSAVSRITHDNAMTKEVGEVRVYYGNENSSSTDFLVGDGLEIVFGPEATEVVDFWGKIEKLRNCLEDVDELTAYDWRVELFKAELQFSGSTSKIAQIMTGAMAAKCRILTTGGVKDTSDAAALRDISGEPMMAGFKRLLSETGYYMSYDGTKELVISDTFGASGVTLVAADIAKAERVDDLVDNVNTAAIYFNGGVSSVGGSGADYQTYGRSEKILVDPQCPNATQAGARGTYLTTRYAGSVQTYDIWCLNGGIQPGETGTITMPYYGITAATFLCLEKHYDIPDGLGFRYRMNITIAGVVERHGLGHIDRLASIGEKSQLGLAGSV